MAFLELDTDTLQEEISNDGIVLVQFSAGWCGNCRIMKPKFKKFSQEHENVKFIVIDAEKNPESRKLAKVDNLPTFAAFKNGELIQQTQTNKTEVLKSFIDETTSN
jgi:thiol-disulfide isomerase/thioredoxin